MKLQLDYLFQESEPAIFVEVYLPKKASYQGSLYEALTQGFKIDTLIKHFKTSDKAKKDNIKKMLSKYQSDINHCLGDYTDSMIDNFQPVFYGYSMYEVDGVFSNPQTTRFDEERTQVIRIVFRPDYQKICNEFRIIEGNEKENKKRVLDLAEQFLRYGRKRDDFIQNMEREDKILKLLGLDEENSNNKQKSEVVNKEAQKQIVDYITRWIDYVALFLFGYLIYEISAKLLKDVEEEFNAGLPFRVPEDEIWVTSFWNLSINRVSFQRSSS